VEEEELIFERTELTVEVIGKQSARRTGREERLPFDLCLVSIGYKARPIPGLEHVYDDITGTLNNTHGKVMDEDKDQNGLLLAPVYVSGWLKRGPSGIIGTNIADAKDTIATVIHDMMRNKNIEPKSSDLDQLSLKAWLEQEKNQENVIDWNGYQKINSVETSKEHKRHPEQPREKLIHWDELLDAAK
jgi:NADPH-dependent glutamate synthase beta subunit-like oxidoreductase